MTRTVPCNAEKFQVSTSDAKQDPPVRMFEVRCKLVHRDNGVLIWQAHFLAWFQYTGGAAGWVAKLKIVANLTECRCCHSFAPTRIEPLIVVASWTFLTLLLVSHNHSRILGVQHTQQTILVWPLSHNACFTLDAQCNACLTPWVPDEGFCLHSQYGNVSHFRGKGGNTYKFDR